MKLVDTFKINEIITTKNIPGLSCQPMLCMSVEPKPWFRGQKGLTLCCPYHLEQPLES